MYKERSMPRILTLLERDYWANGLVLNPEDKTPPVAREVDFAVLSDIAAENKSSANPVL